MQINGMPNKFEIFQDFYASVMGEEITYTDALRLYGQMDSETKTQFEDYCDEVGYIIVSPNGYNLPTDNTSSKNDIKIKYTLETYAKKNGLVMDPQWAIYSAEEIIQMFDQGINIPQEVVDVANTILQSTSSYNQEVEGEDSQEDTTLSFLELIPEAEKKIEKCEKNNEKIEEEIKKLIPEQQKQQQEFKNSIEEQLAELETYENNAREWKRLDDKLKNGEHLTDNETKRYSELSEALQDKQSKNKNNSINKVKISASLNQLNVLSIIGEKLAEETIVIGDTLADYTSKTNYKTTFGQASGEIGFLRAIISMAQGKTLAKEANEIGNDTKEYSEITNEATDDIAEVFDIELNEVQIDENGEVVQEETSEEITEDQENDEEKDKYANFVVTDESVLELIDEAKIINNETLSHVKEAKSFVKTAKKDINFAEKVSEKVETVVEEYKAEEEERQNEISQREEENKEAEKEIEKLKEDAKKEKEQENNTDMNYTVKNASQSNASDNEDDENLDKETQEKINNYEETIETNNKEIEAIKVESKIAKEEVTAEVAPEKSYINKAVPEDVKILETVSEYAEEEIPEVTTDLQFTMNAGLQLASFGSLEVTLGSYYVSVGAPLLSNPFTAPTGIYFVTLGTAFITKGSISIGIGTAAVAISETGLQLEENAEKINTNAIDKTGTAITDLTNLDETIIEVTGEESALASVISSDEEDEEDAEGVDGEENVDGETPVDGEAPVEGEAPVDGETPVDGTGENEDVESIEDKAENAGVENPIDENGTLEENLENVTEGAEETAEDGTKNATNKTEEKEESPEDISEDADRQQKQLEKQTDTQEDIVKDSNKQAKDAGKESKKIEKDETKSAKQLEKEAKKLEQQILQEQEKIIKLNKESQAAVAKQATILVEYETLSSESEKMAAEEEAKQLSKPKQAPVQPQPKNNDDEDDDNGLLSVGNTLTITSTSDGSDNQSKLASNDQRITELGIEYKAQDNIVVRNRKSITKYQKSITNKSKKFEKKLKLKTKKLKETEKKEKEKQKKLNKIFGAIGIAENIFSITSTTGTILTQVGTGMESSGLTMIATGLGLMFPPAFPGAPLITAGTILKLNGIAVQSVGNVLTIIGTVGVIACGVTKGIINIANGNLAAGLMAIGSAAVTAATSFAGGGAAAGSALQYVSEGLSIVSSSAELVNNVRAVQGKEANSTMSKIGTIAGVGSAVTGAASSISKMGDQNTMGKISTLVSAAGTALSSTSQLMTEFGGDEKAASILGTIGGGLQTLGSLGQLANKNNKNENKNDDQNNQDNDSKNDKMNKTIDKSNLTPEQKALAKAAVQELKNNPNIALGTPAEMNAAIDKQLNSMDLSDKQKQALKKDIQKSIADKTQQPAQTESAKKPENEEPKPEDETGNTTVPTEPTTTPAKPSIDENPVDTTLATPEEIATNTTATGEDLLQEANNNQNSNNGQSARADEAEADANSTQRPKDEPKVETPEAPEAPEVPETPEAPEAPETPEVPETPEAPEAPESDIEEDDIPTFTEDEINADEPEQKPIKLEKVSDEEFALNNMEENGSSREFSDLDDNKLDEYKQDAMGEGDDEALAKYEAEQELRANAKEFKDLDDEALEAARKEAVESGDEEKAKKYENEAKRRAELKDYKQETKTAKNEKINKIIDTVGQGLSTGMQMVGMFMSSNMEGTQKNKYVAPGRLTSRTRQIMKENNNYRRKHRVSALARSQRYYA